MREAGGKLVAGSWKEQVKEAGCGAPRTLNALTTASPAGLDVQPLLPGTTIADPTLQADSVPFAANALGAMPQGCEQGGVTDTRFVAMEGSAPGVLPTTGQALHPWTELWTLQACAKRVQVQMRFTPDATGTGIASAPAP